MTATIVTLLFSVDLAAVSVGLRIFRIEFDAAAVIGNSPFQVAFLIPGVATVEVDNGIFRIDLYCAIVVAYGPLQIALLAWPRRGRRRLLRI